jgi:hypothetical protein
MKLNTSWKTNTAGIAAIVAGLANLTIDVIQHGSVTTSAAGIAVTAVIAGIGLINAKDGNVSNSPTPLSVAQPVEQTLAAVGAVAHVPEVAAAITVAETVGAQVLMAPTVPPPDLPKAHQF